MAAKTAEKEYEIHYYEVDYKKEMLLTSLMNYFGDLCTRQSEGLGLTFDYMKENNCVWVLYKWDINIKKYPVYGEVIKIKTIPNSFRRFYGYRKFEVRNQKDELIIEGDSMWFLIDMVKRKPLKIPKEMYDIFGIFNGDNEKTEIRKIKLTEEFSITKNFYVRYSDIDTNLHVNNVKYADWVLETIPMDIVTKCSLKSINITYEKETMYGDMIKVYTNVNKVENGAVCLHKIEDSKGNILTVAETCWG